MRCSKVPSLVCDICDGSGAVDFWAISIIHAIEYNPSGRIAQAPTRDTRNCNCVPEIEASNFEIKLWRYYPCKQGGKSANKDDLLALNLWNFFGNLHFKLSFADALLHIANVCNDVQKLLQQRQDLG
ncbi:hypothetical protein Tco_0953718 [Tanacetum coccineum]|uniref:Uncharacterized protein n=1 Tax=Tanacetum coccineum TaxID=301880 RepID=A0ABQ5E2L7_9ASTR